MRGVLIALVGTALLPASASAATVEAGPLRAEVREDPWALSFITATAVLAEHPGTGSGPTGTLGFRTAAGWSHATRVRGLNLDNEALVLDVATNDPLGRTLDVRIAPNGDGVIRLVAEVRGPRAGDVEATGIAFQAVDGERYLGFGERSNVVDARGTEVQSYVAEGTFQPEERPFANALIPPWGYRARDDATYYPMPWLLSTRGYGVLVDSYDEALHRLGTDDPGAWSAEVLAPRIALRVFAGPRPADVLRRMTERTGRQPRPQAPWFFGPWFQTGQENYVPPERERQYLDLLQKANAPVSVAETHRRYLPCGSADSPTAHQQERARTRFFHRRGLAVLTYFNPMICTEYTRAYNDAARRGALLRRANGEPYTYPSYVGERQPPLTTVAQVDFTAPAGRDFFAEHLSLAVADGHDGWMEDFGEYTPPDGVAADGTTGTALHNRYVVDYHCAGWEFAARAPKPIAGFIRSGYTGTARCAQIVWGGDPTTSWGFDGLASAVKNGLTMGLSGVGLWGSDIGGFHSFGFNELTPELLIRWIQFGAVSGVMRTKAAGFGIPARSRPQIWEPEILPHWRRWARFHTQLYPYLAGAFETYRRTGIPVMRHLALAFPRDRIAIGLEDEFMFGPAFLAAPVLEPDARRRKLYVPPGRWVDLWRSARYSEKRGGIRLRRARVLRGGREVAVPAPLDQLPLLVRAGSVFPMLSPDVDTLAHRGKPKGVVRLRDRAGRMRILAFPRGFRRFLFGRGERLVSREPGTGWQLRIVGKRKRRYAIQASLALTRRPLRPCAVSLDGRGLPESTWNFNPRTKVIRIGIRLRRGHLFVHKRCRR